MLARRAAGLIPPLAPEQALEVTKIHSVARGMIPQRLFFRAPIRAPHHTVSPAGLLGGGTPIRPGELSLAHNGLLFLDELPEYSRPCLEGLREPLEDGSVSIARASGTVRLPARFQLLGAMNPCPCGYLGHPERTCTDSVGAVARYQQRLSGPLLDRFDLVVPLAPVSLSDSGDRGEPSAEIRQRIVEARRRQNERLTTLPYELNARIPAEGSKIEELCALEQDAAKLLAKVTRSRRLSPRAQHRLRRVARTIADLTRPHEATNSPLRAADIATAAALRRLPDLHEEVS
jgi:magnesium chelatase family protein